MRILFSADIHGEQGVFEQYSRFLTGFDCGVLAGDLVDELVSTSDAQRFGFVSENEPEELPSSDIEDFERRYHAAFHDPNSLNRRALERKKDYVIDILNQAKRPVFLVTGNHDIADWKSKGLVRNIENKAVPFGGYLFIGIGTYSDAIRIEKAVLKDTILVSHCPPYGILDKNAVDQNIGVKDFLKVKDKVLLWLFGHVHESFGLLGNCINGSWFLKKKFVSIDLRTRKVSYLGGEP